MKLPLQSVSPPPRNYSKRTDQLLMEKVVYDLTNNKGGDPKATNIPCLMRSFATHFGILFKTLRNYVGEDVNKRLV